MHLVAAGVLVRELVLSSRMGKLVYVRLIIFAVAVQARRCVPVYRVAVGM